MKESSSAAEIISGEKLEEEHYVEQDETILDRLKQFSYYLVESIELNLDLCLNLLEERPVPTKPNSIPTTVVSKSFSAVPKIGTGIGSAIARGESLILEKIDKNNSKILADLVYHYSDHKKNIRQMIILSAIDLFRSFEYQFLQITCNEGPKKAMQKLAKDASDRIFNYRLSNEQKKDITKDDFTKGVIYGNSNRNKIGVREGRSVKNDDMVWKTSKLYTKTGIVIPEDNAFYKNKDCRTEKYGHRRMFPWENLDLIKANWERQDGLKIHNYILTGEEDLLNIVHDYVMTKNPYEEAKLEREKNHEELAADLQTKHEAVLSTFRGNFKEVLDELEEQYNIISGNHQENKELLVQVSQKQDDEKVLHIDIHRKLEKLTNHVSETKTLVETSSIVVQSIASSQNNREVLIVDHIQDIVKTETLNSMSDNLTGVIKEKLRENDPGSRINREFKRNLTQIKKLW